MNIPASDASIPILTQVIEQAPAARAAMSPQAEAPRQNSAAIPLELARPESASTEWTQIEREISERVLRQIQGRIDFVLEHRIKDGLAEALQRMTDEMTAEIRRGLQITLEDVIARAVAQEIARLQANK